MAKTILNFPIETPEAQKFWASPHISNQAKSIIAFSLNEKNAQDNLRRYGYKLKWRQLAWKEWGKYVNNPSMSGVPFSTQPWWKEMGDGGVPPDPKPPAPIDFMSASLDSRVKVTCSTPHSFIGQDGLIQQAAANTWPLSYKDGVAIGRHEPEPAGKNYQPDMRITDIGAAGANNTYILAGGTGEQITGAPDGKSAFFINNAAWNKYGVYNHTTPGWIIPEANIPSLSTTWKRLVAKYSIAAPAQIRTYMMRAGSANYIYGRTEELPAGEVVSSVYHEQKNGGIAAALVQVEVGDHATSPMISASGESVSRDVMVVKIPIGNAKSCILKYSDGTTTPVTFSEGETEYALPLSQKDWGTRYITGVEYKL